VGTATSLNPTQSVARGNNIIAHQVIRQKAKMSQTSVTIQIIANVFAVVNIYLLAHDNVKLGCQIGLFGQVIWMYIFIANGLPWLIFTDAILFGIYVKKLWQIANPKPRRFQL